MRFSASEKKGNTPKTCKGNQCVDDSGDNGLLATSDPCYEIEFEKSDAAPVKCADYNKYEGESVEYHSCISFRDIRRFGPDIIFSRKWWLYESFIKLFLLQFS